MLQDAIEHKEYELAVDILNKMRISFSITLLAGVVLQRKESLEKQSE